VAHTAARLMGRLRGTLSSHPNLRAENLATNEFIDPRIAIPAGGGQ